MLAKLHQDHLNIARLLELLKSKLNAIHEERPVDYALMRDVIDYLREVADKYHHPKEDLIYDYYLKYRLVEGNVSQRLQLEHASLVETGSQLKEMVEMILMDAVIPLDQFTAKLAQFVALQEGHMNYEEGVVFPHLRDVLTEDDWRQLEQQWQNRAIGDPLFGPEVSQHFQELARRLSLPVI
jgi:hemerythrin-like domain-containing protein